MSEKDEMQRAIDELNKMLQEAHDRTSTVKNPCGNGYLSMDLGDFGNAVGIVIQQLIQGGCECSMEDFQHGFKHGVSLIDGTH